MDGPGLPEGWHWLDEAGPAGSGNTGQHYGQMDAADEIMEDMGKRYTAGLAKELKYELQFQLRGVLYRLEEEYILKPDLEEFPKEEIMSMPESFRFENCAFYEDYRALLKKYTWRQA